MVSVKPLSPMGNHGQRMDHLERPWKMRMLRTLINVLKVCTCPSIAAIAVMLLVVDELRIDQLLMLNATKCAVSVASNATMVEDCRVKVWSVQTVTALMGSSGGVNKIAIGARCRHNEYTEGWRHNSAVQQFEDVKPRVAAQGCSTLTTLL